MPFTPYHFGPGLFLKSLFANQLSFAAFVASQVVIDCETLYHILRGEYPLHRVLHTFAGAIPAGLGVALLMYVFFRLVRRLVPSVRDWIDSQGAEVSLSALLVGGFAGGLTHPFFDGIMHVDVFPFSPWSKANPFYLLVNIEVLQMLCLASAAIGVVVLIVRVKRDKGAVISDK